MNQTTNHTLHANHTPHSNKTANAQTNSQVNHDIIKAATPTEQKFYDFYLEEHQNMACRRLHFAGSSFGLLGLAKSVKTRSPKPLLKGIVAGYACAWVGHFFFEKNTPAAFSRPIWAKACDWVMIKDIITGKIEL